MAEVLSTDQATIEGGTLAWQAESNTTVARSTAQARGGAASLATTATAAGNVQARVIDDIPAVPGRTYTYTGWFRAGATGHFPQLSLYFLPGFEAAANGSSAAEVADTWVQAQNASGVAPAGTTHVRPYVTAYSLGAGEAVHWDDLSVDDGVGGGTAHARTVQRLISTHTG